MRSSGSRHSSSIQSSVNLLSARKTCRKLPANVVVSLLDKLESLRDMGVKVPSVFRDTVEAFRAVLVVPYEAMEPFRCELVAADDVLSWPPDA